MGNEGDRKDALKAKRWAILTVAEGGEDKGGDWFGSRQEGYIGAARHSGDFVRFDANGLC